MTILKEHIIEDLRLRGLSAHTKKSSISGVRQLAQHYGKPLDRISENELRQYFLYTKNELKLSADSSPPPYLRNL